jgi:hypothetical protein
MIKWIIPSMSSVVEEALIKLRRETDEARRIAAWYERNPTKLYLPQQMESFRGKMLSMVEVSELVFDGQTSSQEALKIIGRQFCAGRGIELHRVDSGKAVYAKFSDVENSLLKDLPRNFPVLSVETGLKYSDALCIIRRNSLSAAKAPFRSVIGVIEDYHIYSRLGARSHIGVASVFDRHGFKEPDGSPIKITSHQFRHYLNTLAQAGGLSQLDVAKWSGRKSVRQNGAYDHVSAEEMLTLIRAAVGENRKMFGPLSDLPKAVIIPRDEFARLKVPTAHTTDFGYCVHDFTMSPCQQFRDCLNCEEQVCLKGDTQKTERLKQHQDEIQRLLNLAKTAADGGEFGASRWAEHHRMTLARLNQLCEILDDPTVPVGSFIQLASPSVPSAIAQANARRLSAGFEAPKLMAPLKFVQDPTEK